MWWKYLLLVAMGGMIVASFVTPAPQATIGEASRVFYYHIPTAWICVVAYMIAMIQSIRYLRTRQERYDDRAVAAAALGTLFCFLATVTGSIFAKVTWGSFWNWDPRETSVFILLLVYGAYFSLRAAVEDESRRAALAAVYSIFAFLTVPFLVFVVPRIMPSLHPADSVVDESLKFTMGSTVRIVFFSSLGLFTAVFLWMYSISVKLRDLERRWRAED
ncbi:MAG: cytochrome c biogenesis protein [bacterium]